MAVHLDHLMVPSRSYRHFLLGLREQVRRHYRDGLSDFEMKPRIAQRSTPTGIGLGWMRAWDP